MPYQPSTNQYAFPADLFNFGLSQQALSHPSTGLAQQNAALLHASEYVDSFLRDRFLLPLKSWGTDIVRATCAIASMTLVTIRGYDPMSDGVWKDRNDEALKWLSMVASGKVLPNVTDSSANAAPGVPALAASPQAVTPTLPNTSGVTQRGTAFR